MRPRLGPLRLVGLLVGGGLLAGCAGAIRVVPVASGGVTLAADGSVAVEAEGVRVTVRPSAWHGSPSYLPLHVTPFHLLLTNESAWPVRYEYVGLRLFDEARFQYTALPPAEVVRLLQWSEADLPLRIAAAGSVTVPHARRRLYWDPWWWGWPPWYYYPPPPRLDDIMQAALPVGALQPRARIQGFVYFPRVREEARELSFELHYALGDAARVFTLPFAIQRTTRSAPQVRAVAGR